MCLLPANLIRPEVNKLKAEANHHSNVVVKEKMKMFIHYYERYRVLQKSPEMFSVHGIRHRTNNASKSLHSKMNRFMTAHPGFWRFLDEFQRNVSLYIIVICLLIEKTAVETLFCPILK